jgi:hypothetical protein
MDAATFRPNLAITVLINEFYYQKEVNKGSNLANLSARLDDFFRLELKLDRVD